MVSLVALLRAVNVGGTGKLPMSELRALCEAAGFQAVQTYIASGNAVFRTSLSATEAKAALETRLQTHVGQPVGVVVRTAAEMNEVLQRNPFADAPGNRVTAIFLDHPTSPRTLDGVTGQAADEAPRTRPSGNLRPLRQRGHGQVQTAHPVRPGCHGAQHEHHCKACHDGR